MQELPWIKEIKAHFGLNEIKDNAELKAWLKSDGKTLGDPSVLPWCADAVQTAIVKSLPKEPITGDLAKNPYWAKNWLLFGDAVQPCYGAVAVFGRTGGGHVGFIVGEDADDWFILGGNQNNSINITRIAKARSLGYRWPKTFKGTTKLIPKMDEKNNPRTTNEF